MAHDLYTDLFAELGIPADYGVRPPMQRYKEVRELQDIGQNIVGRMQQLAPECAKAWHAMVRAAANDQVTLLPVSGFRSVEYQAMLIRKKLSAGQRIDDILKVNVAPGFSQHHTGNAMDIATPGYKPLSEEFEESPAFEWLSANAYEYGFSLSYPRNNNEGVIYEPWHWYRSI